MAKYSKKARESVADAMQWNERRQIKKRKKRSKGNQS